MKAPEAAARGTVVCAALLTALHAVLAPAPAGAQLRVPRSIEGMVADTGGAPIVAALVTLQSLQPPARHATRTDSAGIFRFEAPGGTGEYVLDVMATGFRPVRRRIGNDAGQAILRAEISLRPMTQLLSAVRVVAGPPPPPKPFEFAIGVGGTEAAAGGTRAATGPALGTFLDALRTNLMTDAAGLLGLPAAESQTQLNGLPFHAAGLPRSAPVSIKAGVGEYDVSIGGFSGGRIAVDLMQAGEFTRRSGEATIAGTGASAEARGPGTRRRSLAAIADVGGTSRIGTAGGLSWGVRAARTALPSLSLEASDTAYLATLGVSPTLRARVESLARARGLWGTILPLPPPDLRSAAATLRLDPRITTDFTNAFVFAVLHARSAPGVTSAVAAPAQARGQQSSDMALQHLFRVRDRHNAAWDVRTGIAATLRRDLSVADGATTVTAQARDAILDPAAAPDLVLGGPARIPGSERLSADLAVQRDRLSHGDDSAQTRWFAAARTDVYRRDAIGPQALLRLPSLDALQRLDAGTMQIDRAGGARARTQRFTLGASRTRRLSDVLRATVGLRADHQRITGRRYPGAGSLDLSPRLGVTWNFATPDEGPGFMESNLETRQLVPPGVLRVGAGAFVADLTPEQGAFPGGDSQSGSSTSCDIDSLYPQPTDPLDAGKLEAGCIAGGDATSRMLRSTSTLGSGFRPPRSIRATASTVTRWRRWDLTVDGIIARNDRQPVQRDVAVPRSPIGFSGDEGRPMFAPLSMFDAGSGQLISGRLVDGVPTGHATVVSSDGSSLLRRVAVQIGTSNGRRLQMRGGYVWTSLTAREGGWDRDAFESPWRLETGPAAGASRHQVQLEIARSLFGVTASAWVRAASGTPFTPVVAGDVNGDGSARNDRAAIPVRSSAAFAALRDAAPDYAGSCLERHAGGVAPRGACRGPWTVRSALYFSVDPGIYRARKLADIVVVIENPFAIATSARVDPVLWRVQRVDRDLGVFELDANPSFGRLLVPSSLDGRRLSITVRVPLSRGIQRQQLDRWLANNGVGRGLRPDSLAALLARNVPNLYEGLLEGDDELGLVSAQRVELIKRRAALAEELRKVWRAASLELVERGERHGSDAALAIVQRATDVAWEASRLSANRLPDTITPVQESLLPAPASMLVRAKEPIRMQVLYY